MKPAAIRRFVAGVAGAAFFLALVLAAAPHLHEQLHADANQIDHSCAVTFIASGTIDQTASPFVVSAPAAEQTEPATLNPQWVPSSFSAACVFEHAPPRNS